ncbi:MAG: septum formation initiator family protein [Tissierellia bacterium]|nr:septum formation initiator family protein [Tissierellia bacterium]
MKRKKRFKWPKLSIKMLVIILFTVMAFLVFVNQSIQKNELIKKKETIEKEILILEGETKALKDELAQSDSLDFIEKVAREDYGMVKPGEIVYIDLNEKKHLFGDSSTINK